MLFLKSKYKFNYKINYIKDHRYPQTLLLAKGSIPSSAPNGVRGKSLIFIILAVWLITYSNLLNNIGWIRMDNNTGTKWWEFEFKW